MTTRWVFKIFFRTHTFRWKKSSGHKNSSHGYFVRRNPNMVNMIFEKFQKKCWLVKNMSSYCCRKVLVRDLIIWVSQKAFCNHIRSSKFFLWNFKIWLTKNIFFIKVNIIEFFKFRISSKWYWQTFRNVFLHQFFEFSYVRTHPYKNSSIEQMLKISNFTKNDFLMRSRKWYEIVFFCKNSYLKVLPRHFLDHE